MYRGNDLPSKLKRAKSGVRRDVERIDRSPKDSAGAEVLGIGSLFEESSPFRKCSDIDLAARGIPQTCFPILSEGEEQSPFSIDLIP